MKQFERWLDTGFGFTDIVSGRKVKELDKSENTIELEKDIFDDYTVDMAWSEFVQTMESMGILYCNRVVVGFVSSCISTLCGSWE